MKQRNWKLDDTCLDAYVSLVPRARSCSTITPTTSDVFAASQRDAIHYGWAHSYAACTSRSGWKKIIGLGRNAPDPFLDVLV